MGRDNVLDDHERRTGLINAASLVGSAGGGSRNPGSDGLAKATIGVDLSGIPVGVRRNLAFAISLATIVSAFNSGPTFIGMFLVLVSITCFGYGCGSIMNSLSPKRRN